jgi:prepilin-type N-terminal cleavage/methylation domain-containing protein
MKTNKSDKWRVASGETDAAGTGHSRHASRVTRHAWAFTLIELLTVIAVIAVIASLIFPVAKTVKRQAFLHNAQAQMSQLETAIERYKSAYGFYPPDNTNALYNLKSALTNQLYYELAGTFITNGNFQTLDGSARISVANAGALFGVNGFINCRKPGADESAVPAQNFLPDQNTNQVTLATNRTANISFNPVVTPVGGPDGSYNPLGFDNLGVNPWRYVYPGTNNPASYDLWIQLEISGNTNLICNWTKQVQINNGSLP